MKNAGKGKGKGKGKAAASAINPAPPARIFPREILTNILSRLLARTLLPFKSVSKQWYALISSPKFISAHLDRSITMFFFNARSATLAEIADSFESSGIEYQGKVNPKSHPLASRTSRHEFVGSTNGVLCLTTPPWAREIILSNPCIQLARTLLYPGPRPDPRVHSKVSVGLAYDPRSDEYIIVLILCYRKECGLVDKPFVYSWRTGWFKEVELEDVEFRVLGTSCNAVIGGVPYWRAKAKDTALGVEREEMVYYDVKKEDFGLVSLALVMDDETEDAYVGEFKGSLGMVVWPKTAVVKVFDVWVMDSVENGWSKKFSIGPVSVFDRVLAFGTDGSGLIGEDGEGKLWMYEFEGSKVKDFFPVPCPGPGTIDVALIKDSLVFPVHEAGHVF